jgi:hypothetical protein
MWVFLLNLASPLVRVVYKNGNLSDHPGGEAR